MEGVEGDGGRNTKTAPQGRPNAGKQQQHPRQAAQAPATTTTTTSW